jgi:hypothetical protein
MERAITLYQPIASLVWEGIKTVESRSWPTKVRGALWIHSAAAIPPESWLRRYLEDEVFRFYLFGNHHYNSGMTYSEIKTNLKRFPRGVIGGKVELIDCLPGKEEVLKARLGHIDYRREKHLGDIVSKPLAERFAWLTRDPQQVVKPIHASGSQGFWDASDALYDKEPIALFRPRTL